MVWGAMPGVCHESDDAWGTGFQQHADPGCHCSCHMVADTSALTRAESSFGSTPSTIRPAMPGSSISLSEVERPPRS